MSKPLRLAAAAAMLALGGCAVFESSPFERTASIGGAGPATGCHSNAGSYALPKALLSVSVWQQGKQRILFDGDPLAGSPLPAPSEERQVAKVIRVPDARLGFCIDLTETGTSSDSIRIFKSHQALDGAKRQVKDAAENLAPKGTGLLQAVFANTTDQSGAIAKRLARAVLTLVSGRVNFDPDARAAELREDGPPRIVGPFEFDPFDPRSAADANEALRHFGYCVVLEDFTFHPTIPIDAYCGNPQRHRAQPTLVSASYAEMQRDKIDAPRHPGILYRPRAAHVVSIYNKPDSGGPGRWRLVRSHQVKIENLSPIVSVGFSRNLFAGRRALALFNDGALTGMCVSKTSELEGFVQVPYEIVRGIVALPANIVMLRIDETKGRKELLEAEEQVLKLQDEQLQLLRRQIAVAKEKAQDPDKTDRAPVPVDIAKLPDAVSLNALAAIGEFDSIANDICGTGKFAGELP